jgi:hypothetical protein
MKLKTSEWFWLLWSATGFVINSIVLGIAIAGCATPSSQPTALVRQSQTVIAPAPIPIPTLVPVAGAGLFWNFDWPEGSTPSNYTWTVQSATNLSGVWITPDQWQDDAGVINLVPQPDYLFLRLFGVTNS